MAKSKKKSKSKSYRKRKYSSSSTDSDDRHYEHKSKHRKHGRRQNRRSSSSSSEWSTSPERNERSSNDQYMEISHTKTYHKKSKKSYHNKRRRRSSSDSGERVRRYCDDKNSRISSSKCRTYERRFSELECTERSKDKKEADSINKEEVSVKYATTECIKEKETLSEIKNVEEKSENQQETIRYVTTLNSSGSAQAKRIEIKISSKNYGQDDSKNERRDRDKTDLIGKWEPVKERSLKAFTELCKTLTENAEEENDQEIEKPNDSSSEIKQEVKVRHPFKAPPPVSYPAIPMNPAQAIQAGMIHQVVTPIKMPVQSKEVQASFPVSSGTHHRAKENVAGAAPNAPVFEERNNPPVNISAVISQRLQIQKKLIAEPFNVEAIAKLRECDELIKRWSKSGVKPEQFTGERTKNILSKEELEGGYNAWVKKDFFTNLQPIRDGPGLRLLQKMGWTYGQPLGKNRSGFVNPLAFEIRTDRRGLSTAEETVSAMKPKRKGPPVIDVQGKHPVSALSEYCTKQKWPLPDFKLMLDSGPSHHKNFLFKVIVNGKEYFPVSSSPNKKNAKAQAATVALQKLGLIT